MAKRETKTSRGRGASRSAAVRQDDEARAANEARKHAPVSLESGASYDRGQLQKGLDRAVDKVGRNRDAEVRKAFDSAANEGTATDKAAPNALPNHRVMETVTQLSSGVEVGEGKDKRTVGAVQVTEQRQVFDADKGGDVRLADAIGGGVSSGQQSEVLSAKLVEGGPYPGPAAGEGVLAQDGETGEPGTTTDLEGENAGETEQTDTTGAGA